MVAAIVAVGLAGAPVTDCNRAHAFGTVRYVPLLGQNAEHEMITRWALRDIVVGRDTLNQLAGKDLTFGAVGYPDEPPSKGDPAHCDNGIKHPKNLDDCRDLIFARLETAIVQAGRLVSADGTVNAPYLSVRWNKCQWGSSGRAKCDVLQALGEAFHASQDFYSHTNWADVENPKQAVGPKNPKGLGNVAPADYLDPEVRGAFPAGLISGCYDGWPESAHACGGLAKHEDLNKDRGKITLNDEGNWSIGAGENARGQIESVADGVELTNFERAVNAAVSDTRNKWLYFEKAVLYRYPEKLTGRDDTRGALILCVIKSDTPRDCSRKVVTS